MTMLFRITTGAAAAFLFLAAVAHAEDLDETPAPTNFGWLLPENHVAASTTDRPISGVTVTLTGSKSLETATTAPAPPNPPRLPPWLTAGGALPSGFGKGTLTAGAVCGPYTLPINLPFSPPCPYSSTTAGNKAGTITISTTAAGPTENGPTSNHIPSTTIYASGDGPSRRSSSTTHHNTKTTKRTSRTGTSTTPVIKTLPPTTTPANPSEVIITRTVTLQPDPPYTPGAFVGAGRARENGEAWDAASMGAATTLATVRRRGVH